MSESEPPLHDGSEPHVAAEPTGRQGRIVRWILVGILVLLTGGFGAMSLCGGWVATFGIPMQVGGTARIATVRFALISVPWALFFAWISWLSFKTLRRHWRATRQESNA